MLNLLFLLSLSCTGHAPDPVDPTDPAPVDPAPVDPAPSEPTAGAPYTSDYRYEGISHHDAFTFWGWSSDGARYAYETWHPGDGAIECEGEAELTVVDAATDRYAPEGQLTIASAGEVSPCDPPDVKAAMAKQRQGHLERFGIVTGLGTTAIELEGSESPWRFETPEGRRFTLSLERTGPGYDDGEAGAGFKGTLSREGGGSVVFEDGTSLRPWVFEYYPLRVFLSPDGQRAAIVIVKEGMAFEGRRHKPMTSAVQLSAL